MNKSVLIYISYVENRFLIINSFFIKIRFIQLPWYHYGDLSEFLESQKPDDFRKRELIRGVLRGLHHIHACGITHCDIKPENIFVDDVWN